MSDSREVIITSSHCGQGEIGMKGGTGFDGIPGRTGPPGKNVSGLCTWLGE